MIISEADAKTKWCPFTFGVPEQRGADGCGIREGGPWTCCTTLCMAWRTVPPEIAECTTSLGQMPKGDDWRQIERRDTDYGLRWARTVHNGGGFCAAISSPQRVK